MRYIVYHHQNKGAAIDKAMRKAGHIKTFRNPEVVFADRDYLIIRPLTPRKMVERHMRQKASIVLYPHSVLPPWWYDGMTPLHPAVSCILVNGIAAKEAMKFICPEAHVEVIGWYLCPQEEFKPTKGKKILFAPIHPNKNRDLRKCAFEANGAIYSELLTLPKDYQITVRHIHPLEWQGITPNKRTINVKGSTNGVYADIDKADVVIAEGTFMYLAVARGKPTIGINQHLPPTPNAFYKTPEHFDEWGPIIAYPLNYGTAPIHELIDAACRSECSEWRYNNIGDQMQSKSFSELITNVRSSDVANRKRA